MVEKIPESLQDNAPRLILIVDDEARMRRFIRMNMELEGYQVIEAANGMEALEQVRQHTPDLVVMDVMMPEMDGFEALAMLRELSTVPVILLTVKGDEEDIIQGLKLGADDYITKPFSPRELSSRVTAVLRRAAWPAPTPRTILKSMTGFPLTSIVTRSSLRGNGLTFGPPSTACSTILSRMRAGLCPTKRCWPKCGATNTGKKPTTCASTSTIYAKR
jgi:DNA-binding response OmpR family regulator